MKAAQPNRLVLLQARFVIHRFGPHEHIPEEVLASPMTFIARTQEELSVLCPEGRDLTSPQKSAGWAGFRVAGKLDFSLVGVLARIAGTLADAGVSMYAVSTFDTDFFFIQETDLDNAVRSLETAGYRFEDA